MPRWDYFAGRWNRAGSFPAIGKTIASMIHFDRNTFRLDWDVAKDSVHYEVGDTLTCKRGPA
ncbi:MAG: hypothetical protein ACREPP_03065 [Rhodanobacteraceae bacterium]